MEVLSETEMKAKFDLKPKTKFQTLDNINAVLKFVQDCGVEMTIKTSAENLVNGEEKSILGLVWAIMLKFIRIDEEGDNKLNAKDSLLLWVKNKTAGYADVEINDFKTKSWADGMGLAAIIHKHRPGLIDWNTISKATPLENLEKVIDAANIYFGMDKYIKPEEVGKLDENSMVVFVSEFYYGIMDQRKTDIAAKRIEKVVMKVKENERLKKIYNETAESFKQTVNKAKKVLEDRTIDNTLAGASRRLEDFYNYKKNEKSILIKNHLSLEANYNNLSMRLIQQKRPPFKTPTGLSLTEIQEHVKHLDLCEQERKISLHEEHNRQKRLLALAEQHKKKSERTFLYIENKKKFLTASYDVKSVGEASKLLQEMDTMKSEINAYVASVVKALKDVLQTLINEKFEYAGDVTARCAKIDEEFHNIDQLWNQKLLVFQDDFARESYKEMTLMKVDNHKTICNAFMEWAKDSEAYLNLKEVVNSIPEANRYLTTLSSYETERLSFKEAKLTEISRLTDEIIGMKYTSSYSSYLYDKPDELLEKKKEAEIMMEKLEKILVETKRPLLEDHLSREEFKANVRVVVSQFEEKRMKFNDWCSMKKQYLEFKPEVTDIPGAEKELSILDSYYTEKRQMSSSLEQIRGLCDEILAFLYKTDLSTYVYEKQDEIKAAFTACANFFEELEKLYLSQKKPLLEDHLAREICRANVELMVVGYNNYYEQLKAWAEREHVYFSSKGVLIASVEDARKTLDVLKSHEDELVFIKKTKMVEFAENADLILSQKYETALSSYFYPNPESVKKSVSEINQLHDKLVELNVQFKRPFLEDCMAREEFRVSVEGMVTRYSEKYTDINGKLDGIISYMNIVETVEQVSNVIIADECLRNLANTENEIEFIKEKVYPDLVSQKNAIATSKYETKFSSYTYPDMKKIEEMLTVCDNKLNEIDITKKEKKRPLLEDHSTREKLKVKIVGLVEQYKQLNTRMNEWIDAKEKYLNFKPAVSSVEDASLQLSLMKSYEREVNDVNKLIFPEFGKQIEFISNQKHETKWSSYIYGEIDNLKKIASDTHNLIDRQDKMKKDVLQPLLDDHLAREKLKIIVEKMVQAHKDMAKRIMTWQNFKKLYLMKQEELFSVAEARFQISFLNATKAEIEKEKGIMLTELKKQADKILTTKHETKLSTYKYENMEDINKIVNSCTEAFSELEGLLPAKEQYLDTCLKRELEKEKRRLFYAQKCMEFSIWFDEISGDLAEYDFGSTYVEVSAYRQKLNEMAAQTIKNCEEKFTAVKNANEAQAEMMITSNNYTQMKLEDAEGLNAKIKEAVSLRNSAYEAEMKKQQINDDLCKKIAVVVDAFSEEINMQKRSISEHKGEIVEQLAFVRKLNQETHIFEKKLEPIAALYKEFDAAKLENNRHTTLTEKDVMVLWEQFKELLTIKEKMIIEEIENQKLRGITMEQMKEVEDNFAAFDPKKTNFLDMNRIVACLYSLGEERSKKEIVEIVEKHGKDGKISKQAFIDYIIEILGDSGAKEETINGFRMISRGKSHSPVEYLKLVLSPTVLDYIIETSTKNEKGDIDYTLWTEKIYSE